MSASMHKTVQIDLDNYELGNLLSQVHINDLVKVFKYAGIGVCISRECAEWISQDMAKNAHAYQQTIGEEYYAELVAAIGTDQ